MTERVMDISPQERALLNGMRMRPGMYIGELSLSKIQAFLAGYQIALRNCGLEEQRCILPWEFHGFVTKRYGQPGPKGWCLSILEAAPDGKHGAFCRHRLTLGAVGLLAGPHERDHICCIWPGQVEGQTEGEKRVRPAGAGKDAAASGGAGRQHRGSAGNEGVAA